MVKSVPLKAVLRNFLNHFETLESRHKLSVDSNDISIDLYRKEFQTLKELTESLKTDPNCPSAEGENDVNRRKNRYKDILPYDHSRVILSEYPGVPGSDYMNANYVKGSSGCPRAYIAAQGPLPNTVVDFWRMIWETDVTVIVMACNEMESGKYKCESYWPEDNAEPQQYGNITVELSKCRQVCPDFLVRTLKVRADSTERIVCQFHYQTWPDHGVPNSVHPILELVRLMRDVQISETRPILVHCSAGCGRTGTICSIDYVWALLRTGKLKEDFSLYSIIKDMRRQRIAMVQTLEQYMLCYKAVATLFEQQLKMIDSHTYENIDGDGEPIMRRQLLDPNSEKILENRNKFIHKNEKNSNEAMNSIQNSPNEEVRHERLVGKATVIRRPSIAKLKAMFENQTTTSNDPQSQRPISFPVNRNNSIRDISRNCKSLVEGNGSDNITRNNNGPLNSEPTNGQTQNDVRPPQVIVNNNNYISNDDQPIYAEYNPSVNKSNNLINNCQPYELSLTEQKLLHQNHQKLQQEIRQHIQRKQLQSLPPVPQQMGVSGFGAQREYQNQGFIHQTFHQMAPQLSVRMPMNNHIQDQPLPPPPKPPRTYQYHNLNESAVNSLQNNSDGRFIVSVALPRRPPKEVNVNNQSGHYEAINRQRADMAVANMTNISNVIPDTLLVSANNNLDHFTNSNISTNNTIKMMNVSNNNIYETVLPKYRSGQTLEPTVASGQSAQNIHSYFEIMKLRNAGINSTLPFYDALYARNGYMTVPNLRHIPVPTVTQIPCSYIQFKPNFESLYANTTNINNTNNNNITNNLNKTISEQNIRKANEKIANNLVDNLNRNESSKKLNQTKKTAIVDKKEANTTKVSKTKSNKRNESIKSTANIGSDVHNQSQDSNSGTFSKLSNAFRGLRIKSPNKTKVKTNPNNSSSVNNVNNGPMIARPPHSHRFSPPTQWTQV